MPLNKWHCCNVSYRLRKYSTFLLHHTKLICGIERIKSPGCRMILLATRYAQNCLLTSKDSAMEEIAGDAALYADPEQASSIAEKMMRIYKDEKLRNELMEKSETVAASYTTEKTAEQLWHLISKCLD